MALFNRSGKSGSGWVFLLILLLVVVVASGDGGFFSQYTQPAEDIVTGPSEVYQLPGRGTASTLYISAFNVAAGSQTEIYPTYWLRDEKGTMLVDGANVNSTNTYIGETITVYGSTSGYYLDKGSIYIESTAPHLQITANEISSEGSMDLSAYDTDWNELTTVSHDNRSAHYTVTLGSKQVEVIHFKLSNKQANKVFDLGAICTFGMEDIKSLKFVTDDEYDGVTWVSGNVPDEVATKSILLKNSANTSYTTSVDNCYVPKSGSKVETIDNGKRVRIKPWGEVKIKAVVEAGTTDPTVDTGDFAGVFAFDTSYQTADDGTVKYGFYADDEDEEVTTVGLNETGFDTIGDDGALSGSDRSNDLLVLLEGI